MSVPTTAGPMPGLLAFAGGLASAVPPYFWTGAVAGRASADAVVGMSRVRKPPDMTAAPLLTTTLTDHEGRAGRRRRGRPAPWPTVASRFRTQSTHP